MSNKNLPQVGSQAKCANISQSQNKVTVTKVSLSKTLELSNKTSFIFKESRSRIPQGLTFLPPPMQSNQRVKIAQLILRDEIGDL
jgi:hypothetical protein